MLVLYALVIGVSGSVLVFEPELQEWLEGEQAHIAGSAGTPDFEHAIRAIEKERPGWRASGLEDMNEAGKAPLLFMQSPRRGANYRSVRFNPYTGQVLLDRERNSGIIGFFTDLHFYLLSGSTGLLVSGWMAIALAVLLVTGLVLWWPGVRRWAAALVLRRRTSWRRYTWDLHSVIGFWSALPLLLVTITGIYFAFPNRTRDIILFLTGGKLTREAPVQQKQHSVLATLSIDEGMAAAQRALPADAPMGYFQLPSRPGDPYRATGYWRGSLPYSELVQVAVDSQTGERLAYVDTREQAFGQRLIQYFFTLHFGSFGGSGVLQVLIKILWVFVGLVPGVLGMTGLLMYWNRKLRHLLRPSGMRSGSRQTT